MAASGVFFQDQGTHNAACSKALPLLCVSTAFVAKTLPLPCVFTVRLAQKLHHLVFPLSSCVSTAFVGEDTAFAVWFY